MTSGEVFVHESGLELPVYRADNIIKDRAAMATQSGPTFVRKIDIFPQLARVGLERALQLTEEQFEQYAGLCGAVVVGHTFGVARDPLPDRLFGAPASFRIPGYRLVAEVERVAPLKPNVATLERRMNDTVEYDMLTGPRWLTYDTGDDQFVYGTSRSHPEAVDHFVDLDMKLVYSS